MAWYVYAGIAVANYAYHRLTAETPPKPNPARSPVLPRVDEGASYNLIYGRCRVRSPVLAWHNRYPLAQSLDPDPGFSYRLDHYQVLGIPYGVSTIARLWAIWVGDVRMQHDESIADGSEVSASGLPPHDGSGFPGKWAAFNNTPPAGAPSYDSNGQMGAVGGGVQFYDGRASQKHTDPDDPWTRRTIAGAHMKFVPGNGNRIPGYRGFLSAFHFAVTEPTGSASWAIGDSPNLGAYSYEVSSYPATSDAMNIGLEMNPATVIEDLFIHKLGKDASKLHSASFLNAKIRLQEENHGFSRCFEAGTAASDALHEIADQIDAVIYEDNRDGLIHLKLIRPDYSIASLPHLTPSNCRLEDFSAGTREDLPNKVRVVYLERASEYLEASATAHNQAGASEQGAREIVLEYHGICTPALAKTVASRELSARSRPIAKATVLANREFYAIAPGDPVKLTWPEYGIDQRVFRVAGPDRGTLQNGAIRLDLVEDLYSSWRGQLSGTTDPGGDLPPFDVDDFE